jgi:nitrogen-specific signal transduction histidine kinase
VVGLQGVLSDFTGARKQAEERKRLETQLRQAQKMEAIGHLAGGVAHDFNNLLSPILGYAELILMDLHPDDPRYGNLVEVRNAAIRARDLTRQLLAFGRKQVIEMKAIHLGELASGFEKMLRRTIREDIKIKVQNPPSLGYVLADVSQIEQILMNLAVNAQDAMPNGGTLLIETGSFLVDDQFLLRHPEAQTGEHVMLTVSDTGHGIDKAHLDRIFEPFFTTKEDGKGTGLGLATVYGIVRQHNGTIWVHSEPETETIFKILLPRVDRPAAVGARAQLHPARNHGNETVMVVEDNKMVRKLTCSVLEEYGYKVLAAETAEECLRLIERRGPVDLLVTDVVMPEMNGNELYQRLSSILPEMKVLFMSGYAGDLIAHHGVLQDGDSFIQKPFSIEVLTRKVRQVLDG